VRDIGSFAYAYGISYSVSVMMQSIKWAQKVSSAVSFLSSMAIELEVREHLVFVGPNNVGKSSLLR
jgi:ABC-type sugar transport system ATPase subunit